MERAVYASDPAASRGRLHKEPASQHRDTYQRDRDRIIHSQAFRRLKHKTQVFLEHEGDYYRTRLTHSLEVAQVARTIARALALNEDLAEAVALAHDLGHPPFGHTGEDALHLAMASHGGFDHNAQAIRIVTRLEAKYALFNGLNLSWEALEGIAKHNGPVPEPHHYALAEYQALHDLELETHAGPEAQVAALSDDIAYNNHDLDDGLRAGFFTVEEIAELPIIKPAFEEVDRLYPGIGQVQRQHEGLRRVFGAMVEDLIRESRKLLSASGATSAQDVRELGAPVIAFSDTMWRDIQSIRKFLFASMYRHETVLQMREATARIVGELFALFMDDATQMPDDWAAEVDSGDGIKARVVSDYISGMTDRYAIEQHERLTGRREEILRIG